MTDVVYLLSGDDDLTEAVDEAQHLGTQVVLLAVPDRENKPISVSRNLQIACDDLVLISGGSLDTHVTRSTRQAAPPEEVEAADAASPATAQPASPAPRVTPADLAAIAEQRAPAAMPPRSLVTRSAVPVYSSSTGQAAAVRPALPPGADDAIEQVVGSLLTSWWMTASPQTKREVLNGKPQIPQEMDRTLLLDLSRLLHVDELDEATRFRLREAFWERAERL